MSDVSPGESGGRQLRVDLELTPGEQFSCPITDAAVDLGDVRVNAVGEECNVVLQPQSDGTAMMTAEGTVSTNCLCHVFAEHGCVPHVRGVEAGTMAITTYVTDRSAVRGLVESLRETVGSVQLSRLAIVEGPDATEQVTVDLTTLTPKQREALELAVVRGYFDEDRDTDIDALASELEISKSAVSQRLRAGHSKLAKAVINDF